jgi:plastocyanin
MRTGSAWAVALLLAASGFVSAKDGVLVVRVTDAHGAPVADAVVSVRPRGGDDAGRRLPPARRTIDQKDLAFVPWLEVFRPGDEVVFRNSDRTRHHVYSFSPAAKFEFVLSPHDSSPPLRLERNGVVAVGCNIHDNMIAWLYVSDAPWIVRTGRDGSARFDALPPGGYEVHAWQPRLKPGRAEPVKVVTVGDAGPAAVSFALPLLPPAPPMDHEHMQY